MLIKSDNLLFYDTSGEKRELILSDASHIRNIIAILMNQDYRVIQGNSSIFRRAQAFNNYKIISLFQHKVQHHDELLQALESYIQTLNKDERSSLINCCCDIPENIALLNFCSTVIINNQKFLLWYRTERYREELYLSKNYATFLSTLGKHSRRNFRNAQKKAGIHNISHTVLSSSASILYEMINLGAKTYPVTFSLDKIITFNQLINNQDSQFHSILRLENGEMLSCCSGYIENNKAYVIYQLNHQQQLQHNPSLTNRAFLIEYLIEHNINSLTFIGGMEGILNHFCSYRQSANLWLVPFSFTALLNGLHFFVLSKPNRLRNLKLIFNRLYYTHYVRNLCKW